jgi:leucyl aminopeptidase
VIAHLTSRADAKAVSIHPLAAPALKAWLKSERAAVRRWVEDVEFTARPGSYALVPKRDGRLGRVLLGVEEGADIWSYGGLPRALPGGTYRLDGPLDRETASRAALGWALGTYAFSRYKKQPAAAKLQWPAAADRAEVERTVEAVFLVRDLINTPAEDMGPAELAAAATAVARTHGATCKITVGDALLQANYPMVHAVGRASSRAPRFVDISWGRRGPLVALVGKGVCFDSGGLSLKPPAGMEEMKWDMAGAAAVFGAMKALAGRKARANVVGVLGLTENMPSGTAQRPGDVVTSMSGLTIEVVNTDAEGRLVLADVMHYAKERFKPKAMIDLATLTGAIIIALGHEQAGLFTPDDQLAERLQAAGAAVGERLWRMPLGDDYAKHVKSDIADLKNVGRERQAGATAGAVFLQRFAGDVPWAHIDMAGTAWTKEDRPLAPKGATGYGIRLLERLIADHYET